MWTHGDPSSLRWVDLRRTGGYGKDGVDADSRQRPEADLEGARAGEGGTLVSELL